MVPTTRQASHKRSHQEAVGSQEQERQAESSSNDLQTTKPPDVDKLRAAYPEAFKSEGDTTEDYVVDEEEEEDEEDEDEDVYIPPSRTRTRPSQRRVELREDTLARHEQEWQQRQELIRQVQSDRLRRTVDEAAERAPTASGRSTILPSFAELLGRVKENGSAPATVFTLETDEISIQPLNASEPRQRRMLPPQRPSLNEKDVSARELGSCHAQSLPGKYVLNHFTKKC